jgi:hypothetical protein
MRARITVLHVDGSGDVSEGVFAGWGDQVQFERRFGVNAAVLGTLRDAFDDEGVLAKGADPASIKSEWLAYLAWRTLSRSRVGTPPFEEWIETVDELDIQVGDNDEEAPLEGGAVPTIATATPLPSN